MSYSPVELTLESAGTSILSADTQSPPLTFLPKTDFWIDIPNVDNNNTGITVQYTGYLIPC